MLFITSSSLLINLKEMKKVIKLIFLILIALIYQSVDALKNIFEDDEL